MGAWLTFPTAASPSRTSLTLLLGFGVAGAESAIGMLMTVVQLVDSSTADWWWFVEVTPQQLRGWVRSGLFLDTKLIARGQRAGGS